MFFISILRFIFGYVVFFGKEGFTERFINLCSKEDIPLWNLKTKDSGFYASTTIKGYRQIKKAAKPSGVKVKIRERHGLPFLISRYKYRWGICLGALFFVFMLSFLSTRVWYIEVEGNERYSSSSIIQAFEDMGVTVGKRKKDIDSTGIQVLAHSKLPDFSWVAVNLKGSTATIEVREKIKAPEVSDETTPCNIRASRGGQLLDLKVYEGKGAAKVGSAVAKGDLLIGGITENEDGTAVFRHAKGEAVAKTERIIEVSFPEKISCKKYTGFYSKGYEIFFFGFKIPLKKARYPEGEFLENRKKSFLYAGETRLPLGIIKNEVSGIAKAQEKIGKSQAGAFAAAEFTRQYEGLKDEAEILEKNITSEETEMGLKIKGVFLCKENIGEEDKIDVSAEE